MKAIPYNFILLNQISMTKSKQEFFILLGLGLDTLLYFFFLSSLWFPAPGVRRACPIFDLT